VYLEEREPHVPERTMQFETERLGPLVKHFGEKPLLQFKAEDVSIYQITRLDAGVSGRTVNMETGVLRRMLKRAKVWNALSEDVKALPEQQGAVAKVLPPDLKRNLFESAASRPEWMVAHCAAVPAVSTTCRGVEIKNLRWQDVDLFGRVATIRRSKAAAGHRTSLCVKQQGALAERQHNRRSIPEKVFVARSRPGNEPPPRSAAYGSTTSATKPSRKWLKPEHPAPR